MKQKLTYLLCMMFIVFTSCTKDCEHLAAGGDAAIIKFSLADEAYTYPVTVQGDVLTFNINREVDFTALMPTVVLSEGTTIAPDPASITDWSEAVVFTTTSRDNEVSRTYNYSIVTKEEDVVALLKTQADVDAFAANKYTKVYSIRIESTSDEATRITDISKLNTIKEIGSQLFVSSFYGDKFNGFSGLEKAGYIEFVSDSVKCTEVEFAELTYVTNILFGQKYGSSFSDNCNNITSVKFPKLTKINSDFMLRGGIADLLGFSSLKEIGGQILFQCKVQNLRGLEGITKLQFFAVGGNTLTSLDGLENLREIESLEISFAGGLTSLEGLNNLETVGTLKINNCQKLVDITALSKITKLDYLSLSGLTNLASIEGLHNLKTVETYMGMSYVGQGSWGNPDAPKLKNLNSLRSLEKVGGEFRIMQSNLETLDGLQKLKSVGGLQLRSMAELVTLEGLDNLTECTGDILLDSASKLPNLDHLANLNSCEIFNIKSNRALVNFCGVKDLIIKNGTGKYIVTGNSYNPTFQDLVDGVCTKPAI